MGSEQLYTPVFQFVMTKAVPVTSRLVMRLIKEIIRRQQEAERAAAEAASHGEQSIEKLCLSGQELADLSVPDIALPELKEQLRRYGVDFAMGESEDGGTKLIFKARSAKAVELAYEKVTQQAADLSENPSLTKNQDRDGYSPAFDITSAREKGVFDDLFDDKPTLSELLANAKEKAAGKAAEKAVEKTVEKVVEAVL